MMESASHRSQALAESVPGAPVPRGAFGLRFSSSLRFAVCLVLGWQVLAMVLSSTGDPSAAQKLPPPTTVVIHAMQISPTLLDAIWITTSRAVVGLFLGTIIGVAWAALMIQHRWVEASIVPWLLACQMVPLVALVPLARSILRDSDLVRFFVAAFVSFCLVSLAALRGFKNVDPVALDLMRSLRAGRVATLRCLLLPNSTPFLFSALRVAVPLSLVGAVIADLAGARSGLGYLMLSSLTFGPSQGTTLWASIGAIVIVSLLGTRLVHTIDRSVNRWQAPVRP